MLKEFETWPDEFRWKTVREMQFRRMGRRRSVATAHRVMLTTPAMLHRGITTPARGVTIAPCGDMHKLG
jgi:hypothetical protein